MSQNKSINDLDDCFFHDKIVTKLDELKNWYTERRHFLNVPIYSSFDIRDSGFKVAPVDANIFPAGFNNICQTDKEEAVAIMDEYLNSHYGKSKKIVLITEEHTANPYYWSNVSSLVELMTSSDRQIVVAVPGERPAPLKTRSVDGRTFEVFGARRSGSQIEVNGFVPDLIVSNNDFSNEYADWYQGLSMPMNPPHGLGWFRRRKFDFFRHYNLLAEQFSDIIGVKPWHFQVETKLFEDFDANNESRRKELAQMTHQVLMKIRQDYTEREISSNPYAVIKNNAGTYGLGVTMVESGDDVLNWNYKSRKTMKAAKGGREINSVIVQEGIPTKFVENGETAEPVIYMIGCHLAGGFLRTHSQKGPEENLNSPGAVYKKMCVSDLKIRVQGCPMENVYGWVAKLGLLAVSLEAQDQKVEFTGYTPTATC